MKDIKHSILHFWHPETMSFYQHHAFADKLTS